MRAHLTLASPQYGRLHGGFVGAVGVSLNAADAWRHAAQVKLPALQQGPVVVRVLMQADTAQHNVLDKIELEK